MEHHRQSARRKVFYYLEVDDLASGKMLGRIGDISPDGLLLLVTAALPMAKLYSVAVRLPDTPEFSGQSLELEIETRWQKPDVNPEILMVGCRVTRKPAGQGALINRIIDYYGFSEGYKLYDQNE
ncbi:PilZ domain-containing protein [Spirochaeta dissipatitropha]